MTVLAIFYTRGGRDGELCEARGSHSALRMGASARAIGSHTAALAHARKHGFAAYQFMRVETSALSPIHEVTP